MKIPFFKPSVPTTDPGPLERLVEMQGEAHKELSDAIAKGKSVARTRRKRGRRRATAGARRVFDA